MANDVPREPLPETGLLARCCEARRPSSPIVGSGDLLEVLTGPLERFDREPQVYDRGPDRIAPTHASATVAGLAVAVGSEAIS